MIWERQEGREKERETLTGCLSHVYCVLGTDPQPRHVPWPGIELVTFRFMGRHSNQLSHTNQGTAPDS